ncbi:MAG: Cys-tRNA(Pro) deacylase [Microcoleaceae cyanobacterium]
MKKTNAIRILDNLNIQYKLLNYEVDINDLTAESTAEKLGLPHEQVFKTLVAKGDRYGICFAVIPGNVALNLKAIAQLSENRKIELVSLKEVQPLTGYIRGGVTAIASKKDYPVYLDEIATVFDYIAVSAGIRGTMIYLKPDDYLLATQAKLGNISNF